MIWSIVSAKRRNVGPAAHRRNELRKRCLLSPTGNGVPNSVADSFSMQPNA